MLSSVENDLAKANRHWTEKKDVLGFDWFCIWFVTFDVLYTLGQGGPFLCACFLSRFEDQKKGPVPIHFASEAWPRPGPRRASKRVDCRLWKPFINITEKERV